MILLVIFCVLFLIILTTKLKLVIKINNNQRETILRIYIFFVIYIFSIDLNKRRKSNKKPKSKNNFKKLTRNRKNILKSLYKDRKEFKVKIEKLKLNIDLSTSDAILTSYITATIASIIALIIKHIGLNINLKKSYYRVNPIYADVPKLNLDLFCIISLNLVHIIHMLIRIYKEWRREFYGRTTSNRGSYGNCNE